MPELPEVETTVRGLRDRVVGHTIRDFWCDHERMVRYISPSVLRKLLVGKKIIGARRRGKNVIIDLSSPSTALGVNKSLVIHMKMTGHLLYGTYKRGNVKGARSNLQTWRAEREGPLRDDPYNRFIHAVFTLNNGRHIAFCDMRKFGKIAIHDTDNLHTSKELLDLGPELWEIDSKKFALRIGGRAGKIKQVLLDQKVLAGVGNIYSDEGLWAAGIHPLSKTSQVPKFKLLKLFKSLIQITKRSLKTGGDSMSDYRNIDGIGGRFQNFHRAYRQTGKACQKRGCSGKIKRIVVGTRSAHFCPKHQMDYS